MFIKLVNEKGESRYLNANHIMSVRAWDDGKLNVTMTDHSITLNSEAECKQLLSWLERNHEDAPRETEDFKTVRNETEGTHPCGQSVEVGERWNGLAWVKIFSDPATLKEIHECPKCGEALMARDFVQQEAA